MSELRTIRLYGHLGKRFGKVHHYAIACPGEAVRAMCATLPGFRDYLSQEHAQSKFQILVGDSREGIGLDQLSEISGGQEIRIVPVVHGGKSALGQILIGAALIWATAGWGAPETFGGMVGQMGMAVGMSMMLGGVAMLLASPPDPDAYGDQKSSYLFSGTNQTVQTGGPVPVLYGMLEIQPTLISGGILPEAYGKTQIGLLGDGLGNWSGDGLTTPLAASLKA